jgi:hypothetical protein
MAFDYKKEYKEYYLPATKPTIIEIPEMRFLAVRGSGNPNEENGEYQRALNFLYGMAYTLKMSYKSDRKIEGFFEYVVPPLEGFWWQEKGVGIDYFKKDTFQWISIIRLPDFVKEDDFLWAKKVASEKKKMDFSDVEYLTYNEGLCVQCMHVGSFDDEPATISLMEEFAKAAGYQIDISDKRYHHEIYLSDPRKCDLIKMKTVIRHPVKKTD